MVIDTADSGSAAMTAEAERAVPTSGATTDEAAGRSRGIGWTLVVTAAIGLIAAFTLTLEKIRLLEDPSYIPSCSLNPVLSCGSVMKTEQAELLGFPNPIIGIIAFSALLAIGVVLASGSRLPDWMWWAVQGGTVVGVVFVHWLVWQSLYSINALCPYCMVVWVVTIIAFVATTAHNISAGRIPGRDVLPATGQLVTGVVLIWLVVIVALITVQFWYYWSTLI